MPWKISIFFYLSLGCLLCGFIFPTFVTQAIGYDIGDMVHWIYGFYILFPRNPAYEITIYINDNISRAYFLTFIAFVLVVESFSELRHAKLDDDRYHKNRIYIIAFLQLMASIMYISSVFFVVLLSAYGFFFSAIFALIGNKELKVFYIDNGLVNAKKEIIIGILLVLLPLIILALSIPFINRIAFDMIPALIFLLTIIIYGICTLIRAKRKNITKLKK